MSSWLADKRVILIAAITILLVGLALFKGIHFGIEFTGGTRIPITLEKPVSSTTMGGIVENIKIRTAKFGLTQVVVRSIGDRQIYVEVAESNPVLVNEIERIIKSEGKFEAIIDGRVALRGEEIIGGSIREDPEISGETVRWGVSFVITSQGASKFAEVAFGKGGYPVYLFLDRIEDGIIVAKTADVYGENFTKDETDSVINPILGMSRNVLLFTDGLSKDEVKNKILELNKTTVVVSEKETELIRWLSERNFSIAEHKETEMMARLGKGKDMVVLEEWPAIGLLSGPLLSESLATGKASQLYKIEGQAVGATFEEKKEYALMEMKKIKSILSGGALPVRMSLGSTTTVPPSLGKDFLNYSIIGIVLVYVVVLAIVLVRYRTPQVIPVLVFIPTCQMTCLIAILGGAGTLDLATIAGLFASMGTAVDAQVVVTDELLSRKLESSEDAQRCVNKAFYIVTRDAAIVTVGLFPLLFSNIVEIIGFITAMVLGTLINIIITTQTYRAVAKTMFKEQ